MKINLLKTSGQGLDLIKHFEGFSDKMYICPAGYPTIGYGHVIRDGEDFPTAITKEQALLLLKKDVVFAEIAVRGLIKISLTQEQFDALVSFTFNLGSGALERSTLRRKINREQHKQAPDEIRRWVWAGGMKLAGLIRRRNSEAKLYMSAAI